jgi:hypothetical protein
MPHSVQQTGRGIASTGATGREVMTTGADWVASIAGTLAGAGRGKMLIRAVSFFGSAIGGECARKKMAQTAGGCHSLNYPYASKS